MRRSNRLGRLRRCLFRFGKLLLFLLLGDAGQTRCFEEGAPEKEVVFSFSEPHACLSINLPHEAIDGRHDDEKPAEAHQGGHDGAEDAQEDIVEGARQGVYELFSNIRAKFAH